MITNSKTLWKANLFKCIAFWQLNKLGSNDWKSANFGLKDYMLSKFG